MSGGRALEWAKAAGLKPQMSYTVAQTARYTGLSRYQLEHEIEAGRLPTIMPAGCERGRRVTVEAVDEWLEANER